MLLAIWQCYWLYGNAALYILKAGQYLAMLQATYLARMLLISKCYWLSDNAATYLAMLLAKWQCCWLLDNVASYLVMLQPIWQCFSDRRDIVPAVTVFQLGVYLFIYL